MGPIGHQRIAQRFNVPTTPVHWVVPKRRGLNPRSKAYDTEAAIVEISIMGAAIVCPMKYRAMVGTKVEVRWHRRSGFVTIRREAVYPGSTTLALYGVEFADNPSALGSALFEHLVMDPADAAARASARVAEADAGPTGLDGPSVWSAPASWLPGGDQR